MRSTQDIAAARLAMYQLLARGFSYPTEAFFQALESGEYGEHMQGAAETLHLALDIGNLVNSEGTSREDLETEYLKAFELNMPRKSCSLYAGSYLPGTERGSVLLSVRRIFEQFGVAPDPEQDEPADFLAGELEFMQFLIAKELQAYEMKRDGEPYRRAQSDFLQHHLALWIPAFAKATDALLADPFYRHLADTLDRFIRHEIAYVGSHAKDRTPEVADSSVPSAAAC